MLVIIDVVLGQRASRDWELQDPEDATSEQGHVEAPGTPVGTGPVRAQEQG